MAAQYNLIGNISGGAPVAWPAWPGHNLFCNLFTKQYFDGTFIYLFIYSKKNNILFVNLYINAGLV